MFLFQDGVNKIHFFSYSISINGMTRYNYENNLSKNE